jgi:O-antigen ligase
MLITRLHVLGLIFFVWSWLAFDHYRPWVNFHSEALAIFSVGLLGASALIRWPVVVVPRLCVGIGLVALLPWVQFFTGVSLFAGDALVSSLFLTALAVSIGVGYLCNTQTGPPSANLTDGVMHAIWVAALLSACIGLLQWLLLTGPMGMYLVQSDPGDRAMGNLGQPNQLATLLLMGIVAYTFAFERRIIGFLAYALGIAFFTVTLAMTESRAGILSAITISGFLMWKHRPEARLARLAIAAWLGLFLLAVAVVPLASQALLIGSGRSIAFTHSNGRWLMWQQVMQGIVESPWVGYGWNQTPTAHAAGAVEHPGSLTYTNAHNLVLDLLAWTGLPLGILLTGAGSYWLFSRCRSAHRLEGIFALSCLLPLVVHSMLEYPFAYAYFLVAGGLMIGIAEASTDNTKTVVVRKQWAWLLIGFWTLVGGYLVYEYFKVEEDFRVVRFENLRIGQTPSEYSVPNIWLMSHMAAMLRAARVVPAPNMSAEEIEELRRVSKRFAYGAIALRYATALGLNGNPEGAARELQIIRSMYGEQYYGAAKEVLQTLMNGKYPQLRAVAMP